jgi:hypothetical protein
MIIHVSKYVENVINAVVSSGRFASAGEMIERLVRDFARKQPLPVRPTPNEAACKPIWEEVLEMTAAIPDEEFDKLPADGAEQHDHCIYGTPKRPAR